MSEKSSKDLDKMFQQEPDQFTFEYNPESWKEMENLLENDDRRRIFWWWMSGVVLLTIASSIYFFGIKADHQKSGNSTIKIENTILDIQNPEKITIDSHNLKIKKEEASEEKLMVEKEEKINQEKTQQYIYKKENHFSKTIENEFSQKEKGKIPFGEIKKENKNTLGSIPKKEKAPVAKTKISITPIASKISFIETPNKKINIKSYGSNDSTATYILPYKILNQKVFGIVVGGETSKVGNSPFSAINWKIGGQYSYRFQKNWSGTIGVNYIQKKYNTTGDSYSPPAGFWDSGVPPEDVNADCNIIEIPLSFGYFPRGFKYDGLHITAGLTSFFMLNEQYDYFYSQATPDQIESWAGKNKNRHWLSIGEISVGYKKNIGHRKSLQVAPYLQIPLTGVGHGKVKLWSTGINLKINFHH